jgi:hypothetical protein
MIKKITLNILLSLVLLNCSIPYDGEKIITVKARFLNANNQPLVNGNVSIRPNFLPSSQFDTYNDPESYTKLTNEDGSVAMKMFSPFDDFNCFFSKNNNAATDVFFEQIDLNLEQNHIVDLGNIYVLNYNETIDFQVIPQQLNTNKQLVKVFINGVYNKPIDFYSKYYQENFPNLFFRVAKNQTFDLKYIVKNTSLNTLEENTITVSVTDFNNAITITY